jgi:hypothetical protein
MHLLHRLVGIDTSFQLPLTRLFFSLRCCCGGMILTPAGVDAAAPAAAAVLAQHFFYRWRTNGIRVYKYNIISKTTTCTYHWYSSTVVCTRHVYCTNGTMVRVPLDVKRDVGRRRPPNVSIIVRYCE